MISVRRSGAIAVACILLGACTSQSAGDDDAASSTTTASAGSGGGNTVGITDDTIKISLIASDLSALSQQQLAPEIGQADETLRAVVDDLNAKGGVAGRQVELIPHVLAGADAILNPDLGRQACVQATEDDKPFAVIIAAAIPASVVQCVANDHDVLTITMDSWPESLYTNANGRLFSLASHLSINSTRLYRAWPKAFDDAGLLQDKTIGIIRADLPEQQEITDESLIPGIEELGYDVAAQAVLPCPEGTQTCEQHQVAIQRMQDAGVDFVFLLAQTLSGSATVEAAQTLGYKPQWATIGQNVTDTVARFYTNAKDNYDGAYGLAIAFTDNSQATQECNQIAVAGGADEFPEGSDGYGFTGVTCIQMQSLAQAIESVDGPVDQASVIAALEQSTSVPMISGPDGTLTEKKHDAGTAVYLSRYSAQNEHFEPVDDRKPIAVGD